PAELISPQHLQHARRRDRGKGFLADCLELGILDSRKLNAEPAEVTDVRGPEEAFGIRLDEIRLNIGTRSTPDRQPPVAVVVVEKHYEARLVSDEEGRATVARAFRCFWQRQADRAHFGERLGDLAWRKPAHPARLFRGRSLRSLHAMELFDGLLDDETLVWLPETEVPGLLARHSELRTAYPSLLAALVLP